MQVLNKLRPKNYPPRFEHTEKHRTHLAVFDLKMFVSILSDNKNFETWVVARVENKSQFVS